MRLYDAAAVIRSKNAGICHLTFDIFFATQEQYRVVKERGILSRELIASMYQVAPSAVEIYHSDLVRAVKITIPRRTRVGSPGDSDVYGCQQYIPLLDIQVPPADAGGAAAG